MNDTADVRKAIQDHLSADGLLPDSGMVVEVDFVAVARVRSLYHDGTQSTTFHCVRSERVEADAHVGMAYRLLGEANRRMDI